MKKRDVIVTYQHATIVVDEFNRWLSFTPGHDVNTALDAARQASDYDPTARLTIYKTIQSTDIYPDNSNS